MKHIKLFEDYKSFKSKSENIYHSTDTDSFFSIIFLNKLAGITLQEINGVIVRGVSCTKDKNFIYKGKDITLELSSDILTKWKGYEIDFFATEFGKERAKKHNLEVTDEKEIFIVTGDANSHKSISPLSKYLVSVKFNKTVALPEDVIEVLETNFGHIKIYDSKNKDITKKYIKNTNRISFDMDDLSYGFDDSI